MKLYVISKDDLSIKDVVQVSDFNIEENINLNGKSTFVLSRMPVSQKDDFVQLGKFLGIISNIETSKERDLYEVMVEDINSLFNRRVILTNEALIASTGMEDFIAKIIHDRFTDSADTLLNIPYLDVTVKSHTPLNVKVDTDEGVFNFRTFLGNVKERYGIGLTYGFVDGELLVDIEKMTPTELSVDLTVSDIVNYDEVYAVDVIAKVIVFSKESESEFNYYLRNDRTITTNASDINRVKGKIESVVCEEDVDAEQAALDAFKSNSYRHNISFRLISSSLLYEIDELYINRPLRIKTLDNGVYSTFIAKRSYRMKSSVYDFECGNIRVNLIDKLKGVL
jgi:hypothetical protein